MSSLRRGSVFGMMANNILEGDKEIRLGAGMLFKLPSAE
jgi:hypothetical protein